MIEINDPNEILNMSVEIVRLTSFAVLLLIGILCYY